MASEKPRGYYTRAYREGVPLETIEKSLAISTEDAIHRFLPKSIRNKIVDNGDYVLNPQTRGRKSSNALFCLGSMHEYSKEFCRTEEGKIWYQSHIPNLALIAAETGDDARKHARKIREGEARTRAKTRGCKFIG